MQDRAAGLPGQRASPKCRPFALDIETGGSEMLAHFSAFLLHRIVITDISVFKKRWAFTMSKETKMLGLLVFCLFLLLFVSSLQAASWYVDKDATGSNNGTSWANAWKSPHDIVWGGSGVQVGDTVYISGGTTSKTYVSPPVSWIPNMDAMLHITISGTSNNRITVATGAKAPGNPTEHSGKVIFDCNQQYMCANAINQSYITLDGEKNHAINWELKNNQKALSQDFIMLSNGNAQVGNKIRYLEIHDGANALYVRSGCDLEIEHCKIYDIYEDHLIRAIDGCADLGSIKIHDNDLTARAGENNSWYGPDVIQGTYGIDVYNNIFRIDYKDTIGYQHQDMIQTDEHRTRIWNNLFLGGGYAIWSNNWSGDGPTTIEDFWFINNVVINPGAIATLEPVTGSGTTAYNRIYILNNTFVDCDASQVFRMGIGSGVKTVNVRIENMTTATTSFTDFTVRTSFTIAL